MNTEQLLLRQQQLIDRSAQLRSDIADQSDLFIKPLALADQVREGVHWLCKNPAWPVGVGLLVLVLKPQKTILWGSRLWWAWNQFKRL